MEIKQPQPSAMASATGLSGADKQIGFLSEKILPNIPHLFSVPTKTPYQPKFAHENQNTPFEPREVMTLQYMTLISSGDRGVGHTTGDWQDEMNSSPPMSTGAQSSAGTPNSQKDLKKPAVKMSIADYKIRKTTGLKPPPGLTTTPPDSKRGSDTAEHRPGHTRTTSTASIDTHMARVPSLDGDHKLNGAGVQAKTSQKDTTQERSGHSHPERVGKNRPPTNGHSTQHSQPADTSRHGSSSRPGAQQSREPMKHPLPPRPPSPRRDQEPRQQKRPHNSGDAFFPEKRIKSEGKPPLNPQSSVPRKSEGATHSRPSPSQKPVAAHPQTSTSTKKTPGINTKLADTKTSSPKSSERPLKLPKILSPLPDDLIIPPESNLASVKMSEFDKAASKGTSSKSTPPKSTPKTDSPDTIVVKPGRPRDNSSASSSRPAPSKLSDDLPPFVLPKLLSPELPDIVEAELLRLKERGPSSLNTVEARHEKARQPGAPGVAQKTQKPKVGHPPKKSHAESSKSQTSKDEEARSLVVKIRYKKRLAKDIQRILALPSKPVKKQDTADRLRERSASDVPPFRDGSDSEEDVPLATSRSGKTPAGTTGQKRPSGYDSKEPALKRPKGPENADFAKSSTPVTPAFKSPAPTLSKETGHLVTPKKTDAIKSVAMRRVESADSHAHTPQPGNLSTPVSAEKPRTNGLAPQVVAQEIARATQEDAIFLPLGTTLKRKMDANQKKTDATENERKVAFMNGIEALMCYMIAFYARDKKSGLRNQAPNVEYWESFFTLWNFIEKLTIREPELHALIGQLGAVSREQWNKANIEQPKERRDWEKTASNLRERDRLWMQCKRDEQLILRLGVTSTLGPWSSISEAVGFGIATLTCYAEKQGRLDWKRDPNFSTTNVRMFMGRDP